MKTYYQPSGLHCGLEFLIDSHWTAEQAMAVVELLDDLRDRIIAHYQLPIMELRRELYGTPEDEGVDDNTTQGDEEEIPF
jgi:hypothetical protein